MVGNFKRTIQAEISPGAAIAQWLERRTGQRCVLTLILKTLKELCKQWLERRTRSCSKGPGFESLQARRANFFSRVDFLF